MVILTILYARNDTTHSINQKKKEPLFVTIMSHHECGHFCNHLILFVYVVMTTLHIVIMTHVYKESLKMLHQNVIILHREYLVITNESTGCKCVVIPRGMKYTSITSFPRKPKKSIVAVYFSLWLLEQMQFEDKRLPDEEVD